MASQSRYQSPDSALKATETNAGSKIVVLVADNHASKLALKMAKALLRPSDELHVLTVVMSESSIAYGKKLTEGFLEGDSTGQLRPVVSSRTRSPW